MGGGGRGEGVCGCRLRLTGLPGLLLHMSELLGWRAGSMAAQLLGEGMGGRRGVGGPRGVLDGGPGQSELLR